MSFINHSSGDAVGSLYPGAAGRRGGALLLPLLVVLLVWAAILFSFRSQVALVLEAWDTLPSHAHGYVVLLVVAYLLWTKRTVLSGIGFKPSWKGFVLLVLAGMVAFLGETVAVAAVVQFSIVLMMIFGVWAVMGDGAFRAVRGPLAFLLFAVPFGHEVLPELMNWTADATVLALRYSGVPVFQEGRNFVIPSGRWSVIEACGGIRYLLTSVFIGAVFAYLTYTHTYKRVLFMVWSVIMPLIANWVRAYVIVMVAHLTENEWGMGLSHLALGWVIFGIAVFTGFAVGARWRDPLPELRQPRQVVWAPVASFLLMGGLASVVPFGWHYGAVEMENQPQRNAPALRMDALAALEQGSSAEERVRPSFPGARVSYERSFVHQGHQIDVFVGYYRNQRQGAELVSVNNAYEPTKDWSWAASDRSPARAGVPEMGVEGYLKNGRHAALHHVYWVNGMMTTSDSFSKLLELVSRLRGRGDDAAVIVITAYSRENLGDARKAGEAFADLHMAGVAADLERVATGESSGEAR
ncbi:exosortase A [Zoogloea sp.]|uniref:exosortase A n=1 Tax=Zoogloea sp. TaxID=49181 RepID=UPI0026301233|nr:exosortase A [uncultured Zoogloea sp.]